MFNTWTERLLAVAVVAVFVGAAIYGLWAGKGDPCDGPNPPGVYCADVRGPGWVSEFEKRRLKN